MSQLAYDPESLSDGELDRSLGHHLRMASQAMSRDFAARLADLDLSQMQGAVLVLVDANPGATQVSISNYLCVDRATVLNGVDKLEQRGLLERRRSPRDRRLQLLFLTPAGQALLQESQSRIQRHEAAFAGRLSASELRTLYSALHRIYEGELERNPHRAGQQ